MGPPDLVLIVKRVEALGEFLATEDGKNLLAGYKRAANILAIEEKIFQGLGLPYHVLDTCTGDLGGPAYRKYDLEAWMPGRGEAGEYGEITSASWRFLASFMTSTATRSRLSSGGFVA